MKGVIRLNDPLIGGGKVIKATGADFMGKPVALSGDLVQCPMRGLRDERVVVIQATARCRK